MSIWRKLKATIVGIHADYHTNFDRLRDKYQPVKPEPKRILAGISGPELYAFAKEYDQFGTRTRPKQVRAESDYGPYGFPPSTGNGTLAILSQLQDKGWSNMVVLPGFTDGLCLQGNHYDEYGTYEATIGDSGQLLQVRTIEAVTTFPPAEAPIKDHDEEAL